MAHQRHLRSHRNIFLAALFWVFVAGTTYAAASRSGSVADKFAETEDTETVRRAGSPLLKIVKPDDGCIFEISVEVSTTLCTPQLATVFNFADFIRLESPRQRGPPASFA